MTGPGRALTSAAAHVGRSPLPARSIPPHKRELYRLASGGSRGGERTLDRCLPPPIGESNLSSDYYGLDEAAWCSRPASPTRMPDTIQSNVNRDAPMRFATVDEGFVVQTSPAAEGASVAVGPRTVVLPGGDLLCSYMLTISLTVNDFVPMLARSTDLGATWDVQGRDSRQQMKTTTRRKPYKTRGFLRFLLLRG